MPASAAGGVPPINVSIRITTTGAANAARAMSNVTRTSSMMSKTMAMGTISTRTLGDAMRQSAMLMKYTVAGAFMNIGKQAIQMSRQFELSFNRIKGLVNIGTDSMESMRKQVLKLGGETTRAPLELADALYYITSAGIKDATVAMEVLEASAKAAAAGLGDTRTVADAVTSTLNAYGTENYSAAQATDILVATVREGKAEADTFAPALGKVLPVAAAFGASFEDVSAAIAALSRGGLSAGTAAIYVRQTLSQLLKPSKQGAEALKAVGTSAEEIRENVQTKGLFPALQELSTRLGGVENASDFTKVFGNVRALTAVLSLMGPAAEENAVIFERMNNASGDLNYAFETYTQTIDAKFNTALAEQQAALINLGDSLKPLVADLLKLATGVAKFVGKIAGNKFAAPFIRLVGVVAIAITVFATLLKTQSAFIRLFSNVQISLFGTQFRYNALTKEVQRYTTATVTATTATGTVTKTFGYWTASSTLLSGALKMVAVSVSMVSKAIAVASVGLMVIMLAIEAFKGMKWIFGKMFGGEKEIVGTAKGIKQVNEVLDETIKYAQSGIILSADIDYKEAKIKATSERIKQQFEENAPDFLPAINTSLQNLSDAKVKSRYVASFLQTLFAGQTRETQKDLINFFAEYFTLDASAIQTALDQAGTARDVAFATSNKVTDAIINIGLVDAAAVSNNFTENMGKIDPAKGLQDFISRMSLADYNVSDQLGQFGKAFTEGIQRTGDFGPLLLAMDQFTSNADFMGQSAQEQSDIFAKTFGPALTGLTEEMDLVGDKFGNLRNLFLKKDNETVARRSIATMFGLDTQAEVDAMLSKLRKSMRGLDDGAAGNVKAFEILNKEYAVHRAAQGQTADGAERILSSVDDVAGKFESGLAPAVRDAVEAYDAATEAIKNYENGQRALMGLKLDAVQANMDFRDSLRDIGPAVKESGADISSGSENADKAKESIIKAAQSVLDVVNVAAASGDSAKATRALGQGTALIFAEGIKAGLSAGEIQALFDQIGFGPEIADTLLNEAEAVNKDSNGIGTAISNGIAEGIKAGEPALKAAAGAASETVIKAIKDTFAISSPSKRTEKEVGKPLAQGISVGFTNETKSGRFRGALSGALDSAMKSAFKSGGNKSLSMFMKNFLEKKGNVETPAQDFVQETMSRMKDIIGSLGSYIRSQLDFRKAKTDLAKLINMQRGLESRRQKALRSQSYAETRFGADGGAMVTGYEQAQLDALQLDFERVSRDYAMGRASYVDLVDAEIALFEARAAASEVSDEVLNAQNASVDAAVNIENAQLEVASATVKILESYQDLQEAAANLYMNHTELNKVYNDLATATGIASGKLQVGSVDLTTIGTSAGTFVSTVGGYVNAMGVEVDTTKTKFDSKMLGPAGVFGQLTSIGTNADIMTKAVGASFVNMGKGLIDPNSEFASILKSMGPSIAKAIEIGANERFAKSPLQLKIPVDVIISSSGGGKKDDSKPADDTDLGGDTLGDLTKGGFYSAGRGGYYVRDVNTGKVKFVGKAVGGPVSGMSPYMVGERGPEMFVPKVSGTIVTTSALERYTRTNDSKGAASSAAPANNIVVTVNNPVPAAAEDSITRRMKVLANSGLFG